MVPVWNGSGGVQIASICFDCFWSESVSPGVHRPVLLAWKKNDRCVHHSVWKKIQVVLDSDAVSCIWTAGCVGFQRPWRYLLEYRSLPYVVKKREFLEWMPKKPSMNLLVNLLWWWWFVVLYENPVEGSCSFTGTSCVFACTKFWKVGKSWYEGLYKMGKTTKRNENSVFQKASTAKCRPRSVSWTRSVRVVV